MGREPLDLIALIPAAGRSRRMGTHKLLLKLREETIIRRLVTTLQDNGISRIDVLCRQDDLALQEELRSLPCRIVVAATDPPEMRDSVEQLIQDVGAQGGQTPPAGWLLIPADHPFVEAKVLVRLIDVWRQHANRIVLPFHAGKRGHPTLFPWSLAEEVQTIPKDRGLNWLTRREPQRVVEVPCPDPSVLLDLDTPADYRQAVAMYARPDRETESELPVESLRKPVERS